MRAAKTAIVEKAIDIRRSPEDVFDYLTDLTREFEWNPKAKRVVKISDGPIGPGTRYEGEWIKGDPMRIEFVRYERPTVWSSEGSSRRLIATSEGRVSRTEEGAHLVIRMELIPKGTLRFLLPLLGGTMRRREEGNLVRVKARLEGSL